MKLSNFIDQTELNKIFIDIAKCTIEILKMSKYNYCLQEFNFEEDKYYIFDTFSRIVSLNINNKNFNLWDNTEWIESMKYIIMPVFSFIGNYDITLNRIYKIKTVPGELILTLNKLKNDLLENYKQLIKYINHQIVISNMLNKLIEEGEETEELNKKKLYLLFNYSKFKDPLNLAYLIDFISYKEIKEQLLNGLLNGINKFDINYFSNFIKTEENEDENNTELEENENNKTKKITNNIKKFMNSDNEKRKTMLTTFIEKYLVIDNLDFFIILLMHLNISGTILIREDIKGQINDYINTVFSKSDFLEKTFTRIEKIVSNSTQLYHNNIKIKVIPLNINFAEASSKNKNKIDLTKISIDKIYNKVINKEYKKFTKNDIKSKIKLILYYVFELFLGLYYKQKEERAEYINDIIKKNTNIIEQFDINSEIITAINEDGCIVLDKNKNIKENTEEGFKTILKNKINDFGRKIKNDLSEEVFNKLNEIKKDFIDDLNILLTLDVSEIKSSDFNIIQNVVEKLCADTESLKLLIIKFCDFKKWEQIILSLENVTIYKLNPKLKETSIKYLSDLFVLIGTTITDSVFEKDKLELIKLLKIISKALDFILHFILKMKITKNISNNHSQKKIFIKK